MNEHEALKAIYDVMNIPQWSPDTLDAIAGILEEAGYEIKDDMFEKGTHDGDT